MVPQGLEGGGKVATPTHYHYIKWEQVFLFKITSFSLHFHFHFDSKYFFLFFSDIDRNVGLIQVLAGVSL